MQALTTNPCFQSVLILVPLSWIGNPANFSSPTASVSFTYIEKDKAITQCATLEGVCMFGHQVQFVHCRDKVIIVQCSHCHSMEHFTKKCPVPACEVQCPKCRGNHELKEHNYKCLGKHCVSGKSDCTFNCLLCKQPGHHHVQSKSCPHRQEIMNAQVIGSSQPPHPGKPATKPQASCPKGTKPMNRVDNDDGLTMEQMLAKLRSPEFAQASGLLKTFSKALHHSMQHSTLSPTLNPSSRPPSSQRWRPWLNNSTWR